MKIKSLNLKFPIVFEALVWLIYVMLYKYSYYLELTSSVEDKNLPFPFPKLIVYALFSTLYIIPFYRLIIPLLLEKQRYILLFVITLLYFAFATKLSNLLTDYLFSQLTTTGYLDQFYEKRWNLSMIRIQHIFSGWDFNLIVTDIIAFTCVAFVRFAFENESRRHELERNNLLLQLNMLKTQLQPHFLFNTLNSIYSFSLLGSPDTSRFILLLSDMMRYILYDCNKDYISIGEEVAFIENYFEMEEKKYPLADIKFTVLHMENGSIPPLLFLPLIENSFKHGAHHIVDKASVNATLKSSGGKVEFVVENDIVKHDMIPKRSGGIGLENIRQRLELYFPGKYKLNTSKKDNKYRSELLVFL